NLARHIAVDGGQARFDPVGGNVVYMDLVAGSRRYLGNAAAHLSRANNSDILDHLVDFHHPCGRAGALPFSKSNSLCGSHSPASVIKTTRPVFQPYSRARNPARQAYCRRTKNGRAKLRGRPDLRKKASKRLFEFRQDIEEVADEAVVGDLEDRGFLVL